MEYLPNDFTLDIPAGCFPLSTDSMLLAHFTRLPRNARVLDLGSGCGTLGVLLCSRDAACHVTGVELDPAAHEAANSNILRNRLENRLESIQGDLRQVPELFYPGSFDLCVSNPPYFTGGPASIRFPQARQESRCSLPELIHSAARVLKFGGDMYLVHRPERMGEIIGLSSAEGMEAKRICLVRHRPGDSVSLILIQLRKGAKPGLLWEEWILHNTDGTPTDLYHSIYHHQEVSHGRNAVSCPHTHR